MLLTSEFIQQSKVLDALETEIFTKSVSYTINFLLNSENTIKLSQLIEIQEEAGDRITQIIMKIFNYFAKYRVSKKEIQADIMILKLSQDKRQILKQKVLKNQDQLRKKIAVSKQNEKNIQFINLDWRFQAEISSKTEQSTFKPNVLLNFQFYDRQKDLTINNLVNSDFANLKHLQQTLTEAFKLHRSNKFKLARNSSI